MKKLLTLSVLAMSALLLAGCANINPTEEEIAEPVAEEVVTPEVVEPTVEDVVPAEEMDEEAIEPVADEVMPTEEMPVAE